MKYSDPDCGILKAFHFIFEWDVKADEFYHCRLIMKDESV